jgi:hypothetical protein
MSLAVPVQHVPLFPVVKLARQLKNPEENLPTSVNYNVLLV